MVSSRHHDVRYAQEAFGSSQPCSIRFPRPSLLAQASLRTGQPLLDGGGVEVGLLVEGVVPAQELQGLAISPHPRVHSDYPVEGQLLAAHAGEADLRGGGAGGGGWGSRVGGQGQRRRRPEGACTITAAADPAAPALRRPSVDKAAAVFTACISSCCWALLLLVAVSAASGGGAHRHAVLHQGHGGAAGLHADRLRIGEATGCSIEHTRRPWLAEQRPVAASRMADKRGPHLRLQGLLG